MVREESTHKSMTIGHRFLIATDQEVPTATANKKNMGAGCYTM